jgi:hypothetical protein
MLTETLFLPLNEPPAVQLKGKSDKMDIFFVTVKDESEVFVCIVGFCPVSKKCFRLKLNL